MLGLSCDTGVVSLNLPETPVHPLVRDSLFSIRLWSVPDVSEEVFSLQGEAYHSPQPFKGNCPGPCAKHYPPECLFGVVLVSGANYSGLAEGVRSPPRASSLHPVGRA